MTSIGECLRRERLRRNLQLEQVSGELKISARMLAAIEAEDFGKLPGGVFAKSFVRQYAHLLGLDEEEMAAEVDRMLRPEHPGETARPDASPIPLPRMDAWQSVADSPNWRSGWSASLPALMLVVVVMLVCSGVYAFFLQRPRQAAANHPKAAAARPQAQTAAAPAPAPPQNQTAVTSPSPAAPVSAPAPTERPAQTAEAERTERGPTAQPTPPGAPAAAAVPPGPVHVEITATEPLWVRATTDGKYAFSGTIEANQSRTVDANQTVLLRLGNAGAATILLNGKPIGEIGPKGQVRNIQLTSGGFQIVAAPKSPPLVDPL